MTTLDVPLHGLLVGEQRLTRSSAGVHDHVFPGTGEVNARIVLAGPEDVDRAVEAAKTAQREWMSRPVDARRDALLALSDLVAANAESLGELSIEDNGSPKFISAVHPLQVVRWMRYYAGWIDKIAGHVAPVSNSTDLNMVIHEPYGVIAAILPWNGPLFGVAMVVSSRRELTVRYSS